MKILEKPQSTKVAGQLQPGPRLSIRPQRAEYSRHAAMTIPTATIHASPLDIRFPHIIGVGGGKGSQLHEWSSFIGIVTAIVGNILISFALNIQRYAHLRLEREFNESRLPLKRRRNGIRTRGYGAVQEQERIAEERMHANLDSVGAQSYSDGPHDHDEDDERSHLLGRSHQTASEDTLTPAEKIPAEDERKSYLQSPYWWAGIIMMTIGEAGNFIAYGFAPASIVSPLGVVALVSNCLIAPLMLKERFRSRDLLGVMVAVAGAVVVVLSARNREDKIGPNDLWELIKRWEFITYLCISAAVITGLMWASGRYGHRSILIDLGLVGLFGGYTALSTKGVASLLSYTLWRVLTFPITYILVAVLAGSALMQIRYLNRALQRFDSTQVIPTQFVLFTLSVILGSAVLYRDFEATAADRVGKFVGGCALTFSGVYLITGGRHKEDEGDDDLSDEEETIGLIDEEAEETNHSLTSQIDRKLLPPASIDGPVMHRTSSSRPNSQPLQTPLLSRPNSPGPSIATSPDSPSPIARTATSNLPWSDHRVTATSSTPRLQASQSTTQVETAHKQNLAISSAPSLSRHPSAPSNPQTPRKNGRNPSPSRPDPSSQARITSALDAPPATPSRSVRNSISHLLPGPLVSPLSASLSGVVADRLQRGESFSKSRSSLRRNRPSARSGDEGRSRRQSTANPGESSSNLLSRMNSQYTTDGEDAQQQQQQTPDVVDVVGNEELSAKEKKSRLRSVSDTLGGLLKGKLRSKRSQDGGEYRHDDNFDDDGGGDGD